MQDGTHGGRLAAGVWLAVVACCEATAAETDGWRDERTLGPFVCRADFDLAQLDPFFTQLELLQSDLNHHLGVRPASEPVELYLFRNERRYREALSRHLPGIPYRRALYVKTGGRGMVLAYWSREIEVDLRHECTHALLHATLPVVPLWLDEGLAEYFEVQREQRAFENQHLGAVRWLARFGITPRLEKLEKKSDVSDMGGAEYRDSWAWVHFMLHGPYLAHDELVRYLADIQNHAPPGILSSRLRARLPDCDRRFGAHFQSWKR
ncbi:MAG: hypothetical protein GXY83_40395 [Rhodopirellula sp.]|nr:hypothetical protein [Rhodopirellula sp.]